MNLHQIAAGVISAINPMMPMDVRVSTGNTTNADGTITPTFADPVRILGQIQPMSWRDIQQTDGLNLQGDRYVIYLNGEVNGLVRPSNEGGDLITLPDCTVWLVAQVMEGWNRTAGWTKCAVTLQNPTG